MRLGLTLFWICLFSLTVLSCAHRVQHVSDGVLTSYDKGNYELRDNAIIVTLADDAQVTLKDGYYQTESGTEFIVKRCYLVRSNAPAYGFELPDWRTEPPGYRQCTVAYAGSDEQPETTDTEPDTKDN